MNTVIVNYGLGNVSSIHNMLHYLGLSSQISNDIQVIQKADKLILPGVGAFDNGMQLIYRNNLIDILHKKVFEQQTPILGICLGMQLMCRASEEGKEKGLGWMDADVIRFRRDVPIRIPHMGWNSVSVKQTNPLLTSDEEAYFYFVHSFHVDNVKSDEVIATTEYGYEFVSAFRLNNIYGVQFHPEKSHRYGMSLLKNFVLNT